MEDPRENNWVDAGLIAIEDSDPGCFRDSGGPQIKIMGKIRHEKYGLETLSNKAGFDLLRLKTNQSIVEGPWPCSGVESDVKEEVAVSFAYPWFFVLLVGFWGRSLLRIQQPRSSIKLNRFKVCSCQVRQWFYRVPLILRSSGLADDPSVGKASRDRTNHQKIWDGLTFFLQLIHQAV